MSRPRIVILGAGPAGLGAAYQLAQRQLAQVTVLERNQTVGGNAGSFELAGINVDYGSHRLHPACDPEVLADIRNLLGKDLLDRPRHGRIRLQGRWVHFPLKPLDLATHLSPGFTSGVAKDIISKFAHANRNGREPANFAAALESGLGKTICREFYFPYSRKVWGLEPAELSPMQGKRRVGANSMMKMVRKVVPSAPGQKPKLGGRFFYPRSGYGMISEAYHLAAKSAGARVLLGATIQSVEVKDNAVSQVCFTRNGSHDTIPADHVWSTIPLSSLTTLLAPAPSPAVLEAARSLEFRAMILIYAVLSQNQFSAYDAHYFPGEEIPLTRLSEPKNYSDGEGTKDQTVLCAELPCSPADAVWEMTDAELGQLVCESLGKAGIPIRVPVKQLVTRRLRFAYPIYRIGYEDAFRKLDQSVAEIDGLLTFGRQGLFAHDNTHHALYMAYSAVKCMSTDGHFDQGSWEKYRTIFESHVVED